MRWVPAKTLLLVTHAGAYQFMEQIVTRLPLTTAVLLSTLATCSATHARTWNDATGRFSIDADFVAASGEAVVLKKTADGKFVVIPLAKLSRKDQQAAQQLAGTSEESGPDLSEGGGSSGLRIRADGLTPAQRQLFEEHWLSQVKLQVRPINAPALSKVFAGGVYEVTTTKELGGGGTSEERQRVVFDGKQFAPIEQPGTNQDFPFLLNLIKSEFRLATQSQAKQFEAALDALYDGISVGDEPKQIKQQGNQWIFVRGKFFEDLSGYILTTKADGKITKVAYSLKIK